MKLIGKTCKKKIVLNKNQPSANAIISIVIPLVFKSTFNMTSVYRKTQSYIYHIFRRKSCYILYTNPALLPNHLDNKKQDEW